MTRSARSVRGQPCSAWDRSLSCDSVPIIEIQALPPAEPFEIHEALSAVTAHVATHLGEDPSGTWALWRPLQPCAYAEGGNAPASQPTGTHPAIVDLFAAERDGLSELMRVVGRAVTQAFGLGDGNVVVRFTPARPEHIDWGD
jgi:hypothetical protein